MIKYGYIKDYDKFVSENQKRADEYIWDFKRLNENNAEVDFVGIEFTAREDFSNIEVIGTAQQFSLWVRENGIIEEGVL